MKARKKCISKQVPEYRLVEKIKLAEKIKFPNFSSQKWLQAHLHKGDTYSNDILLNVLGK